MNTSTINYAALAEKCLADIGRYQLALQVVYELAVYGPGNAAQIAERMTDRDEERGPILEQWVDDALAELDLWSLLDYSGLENKDPVSLVS
jgi:hypothetical protein